MARDDAPKGGAARHLKRYGVFYAIALVVLLAAVVLPAVGGDDDEEELAADTSDTTEQPAGDGTADGPWRPASGDLVHGEGTTRNGDECTEGTHQIPDHTYSAPCLPAFEGDNGGATARGVTADTIKIVLRDFPSTPNQQQSDQLLEEAGFATRQQRFDTRDVFLDWMNEHYELYGRKVEFIRYESRFGNATTEALGAGREEACQDATYIAEELGAFGVIGMEAGVSGVFAECAAERELVVFNGAAYFSEGFYRRYAPYVYATTMSCDRVSAHLAEYTIKRIAGKPAEFAGGDLQGKTRKAATYVPDNEEYVGCTEVTHRLIREAGFDPGSMHTYALDISRMADQANRAIVQFKADGVTTVVTAADPFSIGFLTSAAKEQDYFPEWLIIGTAAQDTDNFGRSYNQDVVTGRMFGLSQLSSSNLVYGPASLPGRLYEQITGEPIRPGTTGALFQFTNLFNMLQAAGPELTAANIERGIQSMPPLGAPEFPAGKWFYGAGIDGEPDHTAVDDSREVYWDADAPPGPDEPDRTKRGSFVETEAGVRYDLEEWPEGDPKVFGAS